MTTEQAIPPDLEDVCSKFRQWRATHPKRHYPKEFWLELAQCSMHTETSQVARLLGIKHTYLLGKIHQYQSKLHEDRGAPAAEVFVEVPLSIEGPKQAEPTAQICCRLEDDSGRSATIQFEGQVQGLLPALGQFFAGAN